MDIVTKTCEQTRINLFHPEETEPYFSKPVLEVFCDYKDALRDRVADIEASEGVTRFTTTFESHQVLLELFHYKYGVKDIQLNHAVMLYEKLFEEVAELKKNSEFSLDSTESE